MIAAGLFFCEATAAGEVPLSRTQVAISAVIIEVSEFSARELGVQMQFDRNSATHPSSILEGGVITFPFTVPDVSVPLDIDLTREDRRPGIGIDLVGMDTEIGAFQLSLRAMLTHGEAEIKAQPTVVTLHNKEAQIKTVDNIPYLDIAYDKGKASIAQPVQEIGITLKVTPTILDPEKDLVELYINEVKVSGITSFVVTRGIQRPLFTESKVENTSVVLKDGQGMLIGGLASKRRRNIEYRVPILGRIPLLGNLFKKTKSTTEDSRVLFLITPHILLPGENPALPPDFMHVAETETLRLE